MDFEKKSRELIEEARQPLALESEPPACYEMEYKRKGGRNFDDRRTTYAHEDVLALPNCSRRYYEQDIR